MFGVMGGAENKTKFQFSKVSRAFMKSVLTIPGRFHAIKIYFYHLTLLSWSNGKKKTERKLKHTYTRLRYFLFGITTPGGGRELTGDIKKPRFNTQK